MRSDEPRSDYRKYLAKDPIWTGLIIWFGVLALFALFSEDFGPTLTPVLMALIIPSLGAGWLIWWVSRQFNHTQADRKRD